MIRFKPPTLGIDIYDVFKTSPGRINPRTGKLVQYKEFAPVAPWEIEERGRRGRRDFEEEERFRDFPRRRREFEEERLRDYPQPRRDYGEMFRSSMAGLGAAGEFFANPIPWVFLGIAAIVALEASGITNFSPRKIG